MWLGDGVAVVGTGAVVSPRRHDDLAVLYSQGQPGRDAKNPRKKSFELLVLHLEVRVVFG